MTTDDGGDLFADADMIHSYSRAQALADGFLVDVSDTAREAGFTFPVALTRAVWEDCVAWGEDERVPQDESGRLWDVLSMLRFGIKRTRESTDRITFEVLRVPKGGQTRPDLVKLWASVGPGDDPAPVMTIMQIGED